ncbi:hypothetical protein ACFSJY_05215 [Thalassotalea euphylliae]|uniref:hypothetical protein n=1 Tax=Thalassotalea euphylliae TaxID=1655234 RepID=UPI00363DE8F9
MVKIKKIRQLKSTDCIFDSPYDLIFCGLSIDDRTTHINELINKNCRSESIYKVKIDIERYSLCFNDEALPILNLSDFFVSKVTTETNIRVLIEATSLDFSEILYLLHGLKVLEGKIELVLSYLEPEDYSNANTHLKEKEEFLLSESQQKFIGLPLFSVNNQDNERSHLIALLGFENNRLGQVLEEYDGASFSNLISMVGIPAFNPGWENRSIHRHIEYFDNIRTSLHSYPATNPYELNLVLEKFYDAYQKVVIASMGTKPAAIAACVFLVNNAPNNTRQKYVGAIYDFPNKSKGRSVGVGEKFMYELVL